MQLPPSADFWFSFETERKMMSRRLNGLKMKMKKDRTKTLAAAVVGLLCYRAL